MFAQKIDKAVKNIGDKKVGVVTNDVARLVTRFQKGDKRAFTELVKAYQRRVYSLAYKMLQSHIDADEVTQETFVRIYNRIDLLKSPEHFGPFILRIATNYAIDLMRKGKGRMVAMSEEAELPGSVQLTLSDRVIGPERAFENKQLLRAILEAAEELPPRQRMTLILHDIEGLTKDEVARIMDCPEATVRSNLHIARGKLKKKLVKFLDYGKGRR